LDHNELAGPLPNSVGEIWKAEYVHLDHNKFSGNFPQSFGQMRFLKELDISYNFISGNIPDSFSGMRNMTMFQASHNLLGGSIPYCFQFATKLIVFDLSTNRLSGNIPAFLDNMPLVSFSLRNNSFSTIDAAFIMPAEIRSCDLSLNWFRCPIPKWTELICEAHCDWDLATRLTCADATDTLSRSLSSSFEIRVFATQETQGGVVLQAGPVTSQVENTFDPSTGN